MALSTGDRRARPKPHQRPQRQEDLAHADRHIAIAKKQIGRQKELIKGLAQTGHETDLAVSLLHAMEHGLRAFEQHREVVLKWERFETPLILKRASASRSSGEWRDDDYDVLENGVVVGRIFCLDAVGPQGRPWMWASGHKGDIRRAAHGYEPTREAAMAAFAKSWRRED